MFDYSLTATNLYEGMECKARFKDGPDAIWNDIYVPIRIEKEYPNWFLCTVLSHRHPKGTGDSFEYPMTINKFDIDKSVMLRVSG